MLPKAGAGRRGAGRGVGAYFDILAEKSEKQKTWIGSCMARKPLFRVPEKEEITKNKPHLGAPGDWAQRRGQVLAQLHH